MGSGACRLAGALVAALILGVAAQSASAAEIDSSNIIAPQHKPPQVDDGWQAGTCYTDAPTCSVATPPEFFEQSAGHPQVGFTQFIIKEEPAPLIGEIPVGNLKTVRVDLPVGLSVNPQATPEQCDLEAVEHPESCPADTKVGTSEVTATNPLTGFSLTLPKADVYNLIPRPGEPARFGLTIVGNDIFLDAGVAWDGDYHEFFTINVAKLELGPGLEVARILKNRLVFDGRSGNGTFITTPSTCDDHESAPYEHVYSTFLRADSYEHEDPSFPAGSPFIESELPTNTNPKECDTVPFDPSIGVAPDSGQTDSPSGPAIAVQVPFEVPSSAEKLLPRTKQASSDVRSASVTLPSGMGLNPSAANGLQTCTDAQFGLHTRNPIACPPASKIGTVAIDTPPLPDGSLIGPVFVGQQLSRDPLSGEEYRIFVDAESTRYGVSVRLAGHVAADPVTGVLITTFDDSQFAGLPQVPFSSFTLDFDGGAHAVLTSPPTCGPNQTTARMTPWSGNPAATPSGDFTLTSAPGGGACASSLAARPFGPSFAARSTNPKGGAFTQVNVDVARSDGNQELKGVDVDLPPGLTAKLAGVRYCPPSALAAAAASSGSAEAADSSCPTSSLIGKAAVTAGSGPDPVHIAGEVFLTGRYHGAPLSLAVITPAMAGPFDLGSVVVRVALFVDPSTAQVHAVSDPIPHVFGGAKLDVRSISVKLDRRQFSLNPTNCSAMAFGGTLHGGGSNPLDPAAFSALPVSSPFQVHGCEGLGFKPKLYMRTFGSTRRAKSPKLRAILVARDGDANIGRAAVTLPKALFLEQASLANVCTRVQFAANECPKDSVYGYARAYTPLLDGPLQGPVYLRSSDNELPDIVAALHGQVDIDLDGRIDSVKGKIRNTFGVVPDVPVSKFILTVRGGKRGLLVNSRNLCAHRYRALARFRGQNGKHANMRPKLRAPCKHAKRHRRHSQR
ncbi:MAG: hypothetical protein ACRDLL_06605 [Solirubrobacterales bacterium]